MTGGDEALIKDLIATYYRAFQGADAHEIIRHLQFPYTFWANGELTACANDEEFARWWSWYLNKVKEESGFVRGEIVGLRVEELSESSALVRMRSSRIGANDRVLCEVKTGFLTYRTASGWKVAALISGITDA